MTQAPPTKVCKRCRAEVGGEYTTCPYDGWQLEEIPPDPWLGKIFNGKYEIESVLGKGGMSIVYKARDVFMDRIVAIKVLHTHLVSDNTSIQRFRLEAQAAGSLNHPNVITVYDFGLTPEEQAFLIMECFEGPTLAEVLDVETRIAPERGLRIMKQICDGLEHAHKKGVVHRDLKPSNLCLVKSESGIETVKIVDFGIAKLLPQEGKQRQQLTQTGQIFGSPLFMSPEQCQGKPLDSRSDLYSLGCLMYESLTGVPPFMGPTAFDTMTMHINDAPKPLKKSAPDVEIPPELENPILRCLEKSPDKRYQTAAEIKADLPPLPEELVAGQKEWSPSWYSSIKHNPIARGVIIVFLAVAVPFVIYFTQFQGTPDDRGTPLDKSVWNLQIFLAEAAMKAGKYDSAKHLLEQAYQTADEKLTDLPKRLITLNLEAQLGAAVPSDPNGEWKIYTKQAITELAETLQERALLHYKAELAFYKMLGDDASNHDSIERKRAIIESRAGHAEMVASELDAMNLFMYEENLLKTALQVDSKMLGKDHYRIADLNLKLADCYEHMQFWNPQPESVGELLQNAVRIDKQSGTRGRDTPETLTALLKLGQFYRDRGNFDLAKGPLEESVKLAESLFKKASNEKEVKQTRQLLMEAYFSYADFLGWEKSPEKKRESDKYFNLAKKIRADAEASLKNDSSSHRASQESD